MKRGLLGGNPAPDGYMESVEAKAKRMEKSVREKKIPLNNVVSLSGGKDSTAMLHMMLDRGESIHSVVFFDTGWEFPEMHEHIDLVEQKTGLKITRIAHPQGFDYWMTKREVRTKKDRYDKDGHLVYKKGDVFRIGNGWPSAYRRWCTREKVNYIKKHLKQIGNAVSCIGLADDELHRVKPGNHRYPLIEYGITEADAIKYCRNLGYTWGGIYDIFKRVSCWCCPLQSLHDLRELRKHRPELWDQLIKMDLRNPSHNKGFNKYSTVQNLEDRFAKEDQLRPYFNGEVAPLKILKRLSRNDQLSIIDVLA